MKIASRPRFRKSKINLQSQLFTLSNAKTYLGRLMEKAGHGETVYIVKGHRRFVFQRLQQGGDSGRKSSRQIFGDSRAQRPRINEAMGHFHVSVQQGKAA